MTENQVEGIDVYVLPWKPSCSIGAGGQCSSWGLTSKQEAGWIHQVWLTPSLVLSQATGGTAPASRTASRAMPRLGWLGVQQTLQSVMRWPACQL